MIARVGETRYYADNDEENESLRKVVFGEE